MTYPRDIVDKVEGLDADAAALSEMSKRLIAQPLVPEVADLAGEMRRLCVLVHAATAQLKAQMPRYYIRTVTEDRPAVDRKRLAAGDKE